MNDPGTFSSWYHDQTLAHPLGLAILAFLAILIVILPRRFAVFPLLAICCFIPSTQRVVLSGLDFSFLRLLLIVGCLRLWVRDEFRGFRRTPLDLAFVAWIITGATIQVLRMGSTGILLQRVGSTLDALAIYFFVRCAIRSWTDLARVGQWAAWLSLPTAVFFAVEWSTEQNVFSILGADPPSFREGRLRCLGAFTHPILAGAFWVSLLPLIMVRWWLPRSNATLTALAIAAIAVVIMACASATPVVAAAAALAAACLYPWRFSLRWVRWGAVLALVALQLVMKAPVWHLISRIHVVGGSTGWHRYHLIDKFIENFDEWWLAGTDSTGHWGWHLFDTTNVYVAQGVQGGLLTLTLMVVVLTLGYRQIGRMLRDARHDHLQSIQAWALGLCLFAHTVMMIAASYYGEILVVFYGTLALVSSLTPAGMPSRRAARTPRAALGSAVSTLDGRSAPARPAGRRLYR